ncbi:hypothetical protein TSAR_009427 [Trichomalopsis sarcophagae]|uniref:Uncharacterized protein n=1 Tax=Trichomalopsis sarcophagae TaxID=543379 RepID=A0A232FKJ0_9HYME|nr:hypothetical protein TSAR_009427 [Trichomalopsis sarcophagae]
MLPSSKFVFLKFDIQIDILKVSRYNREVMFFNVQLKKKNCTASMLKNKIFKDNHSS